MNKTSIYSVNEVYALSKLACREDKMLNHKPIKVLIVGAGSYIGTNVEKWLNTHGEYEVDTLDTLNLIPTTDLFKGYDVVFHVAGIAHRKETKKNADLYYKVNRDLAIKTALAAKSAAVPHFIILSSISVYGMITGRITKDTPANAKNNYGKSKLAADEAIWEMRDENFRVAILRPPMVYGNGCKGNYQALRKLALRTPLFPHVDNQRSMIYIGNLCRFVQDVIDNQREGFFSPQNKEYVNTSEMVKLIAYFHGKKILTTRLFNPLINLIPGDTTDKAFGSLIHEMSEPVNEFDFFESMKRTEKSEGLNIWIFHHYATTPNRNGYIRPFRFAKHLEKSGISTTIFASSYHHWADVNVIDDGAPYKIEISDKIPFVFVKTPSSASGNAARIKNMVSFGRGCEKIAKKIEQKFGSPDIILASSPHPLALIAGIRIARKYHIPCICEIRDLWPDVIFAGGRIKESSLVGKGLIAGEHWIYKRADALIFTKEGDTDYLYEKHWMTSQGGDINPAKCFYINNGVELPLYDRQAETEILEDEDLNDDSFKVVYAGAIRPINDVENIINAAKLLPKDSNIKILIYGDGNLRKTLEQRVKDEKINCVKFKGYVDQKYIPYILSKSSVNLLNYSSSNYTWKRGNSSNKLFEYLASGKPVIATIKTGYSIIEKYNCGMEMEEETPEELAKDIMEIKRMSRDRYEELCANARKAAYDFDYSKLSAKLLEVINWVRK